MKHHMFAAGLALAVSTVLSVAGPAAAGEQVPFHGHFAGIATLTGGPEIIHVEVDATGNATHLGAITLAIPHDVDRTTSPWTSTGSYEFVAANGDTLSATFTGQVTPSGTPGVLSAVEIATITSGTGRFAGATGGFNIERLVATTTVPRTTAGSFRGTISSPGAAKK